MVNVARSSDPEVLASEGLTELPAGGDDVPGGGGAPVTGGDAEGERLTNQHGVGLPVLAPVAAHAHPPGPRPLHAHPHDVPSPRHVRDQHQVEVPEPVDGEPHPASLPAWHPAQFTWRQQGHFSHLREPAFFSPFARTIPLVKQLVPHKTCHSRNACR